jgi:hypothetical protein
LLDSGRLPLGRLLKVGGMSETNWNQMAPGWLTVNSRSLVVEGEIAPV